MNRQKINIGDFKYIVELYDISEYSPVTRKEYVILRNISFVDSVAYDTDIYFIEKSIYQSMKSNNSLITDKCAFPCHNSKFGSFSQSINDFSNTINLNTLKLDDEGGNIFEIKQWNNETQKYSGDNVFIPCDKLKIYHPHNKTNLDYIIYLDNTINGIHFHYICELSKNAKYNSENQFVIDNIIYSEYKEVYIPNISVLFNEYKLIKDISGNIISDDNYYINDFYNVTKYVDIDENEYKRKTETKINLDSSWLSVDSAKHKLIFEDIDKMSLVPMYLLLNPFITYTNTFGTEEKIFFKLSSDDVNNYNSLPINITLYPYNDPSINDLYLYDEHYPANSDVFTKNFKFDLTSKLGFAHNQLCVVSTFNYYNKYDEILNPEGISVQEAYSRYNGLSWVKKPKITVINGQPHETYLKDEGGRYVLDEFGNMQLEYEGTFNEETNEFSYTYYCPEYEYWVEKTNRVDLALKQMEREIKENPHDENIIRNKYKEELMLANKNEDDFEVDVPIKLCGFQIDVATDFKFSNIIFTDYAERKYITDFDFSLVGIFNSWQNIPNVVIVRIVFIDKYLGIKINTGYIILNKELLKYTINDIGITRLNFTEIQTNHNDMAWNTVDAKETKFNFIDKINCTISKNNDTNLINNYNQNTVKVIYKPIFYKTQELQNITLITGMKQKIGINLSEYMTKVSIFKLIIGGVEYSEFGRNDIYTIFNVDANAIEGQSGVYSIVDSADNYVSSGSWSKKNI